MQDQIRIEKRLNHLRIPVGVMARYGKRAQILSAINEFHGRGVRRLSLSRLALFLDYSIGGIRVAINQFLSDKILLGKIQTGFLLTEGQYSTEMTRLFARNKATIIVTASNVSIPFMVRYLIGARLKVRAMSYYGVPSALTKISGINKYSYYQFRARYAILKKEDDELASLNVRTRHIFNQYLNKYKRMQEKLPQNE